MNLIQRLISRIVPAPAPATTCDHETELQRLRAELGVAQLARETAEQDRNAYLDLSRELAQKLEAAEAHRDLLDSQLRDVTVRERDGVQTILELTGQVEETTSRIAVLETRLREVGVKPEQLAFAGVEPPASEPDKSAEEEEFSNNVQKLAYRLVGIFFDDDGPGRRHHWHMERSIGEVTERVKVPIADAEFLRRVAARDEAFGAGDTIVGDFRVITWRKPADGALRVEYRSIDKVHRVVRPDEQVPLIPPPAPAGEVAHV